MVSALNMDGEEKPSTYLYIQWGRIVNQYNILTNQAQLRKSRT